MRISPSCLAVDQIVTLEMQQIVTIQSSASEGCFSFSWIPEGEDVQRNRSEGPKSEGTWGRMCACPARSRQGLLQEDGGE